MMPEWIPHGIVSADGPHVAGKTTYIAEAMTQKDSMKKTTAWIDGRGETTTVVKILLTDGVYLL